jgi:hypothetical protein
MQARLIYSPAPLCTNCKKPAVSWMLNQRSHECDTCRGNRLDAEFQVMFSSMFGLDKLPSRI